MDNRVAFILVMAQIFFCLSLSAQINRQDSTVQVIGYWDHGETQNYTVSRNIYSISGTDTTVIETSSYQVDIAIFDSTANSYTIEWNYRDYKFSPENEVYNKVLAAMQNTKVLIRTDELGSFQEVVNWQELHNFIDIAMEELKKLYGNDDKLNNLIDQVKALYSSKESLEAAAINEIRQFYLFHGVKYKLGEHIEYQTKAPNMVGGEPFDAQVTVSLDEIDPEYDNAVFRLWQGIDSEQLTEATFQYLVNVSKTMGVKPLVRSDIQNLESNTWVSVRMHGGSGWPLYSIETKEVKASGVTRIEERIIEIN